MNDRELLELAAKAAGLKYTKPTDDYDGSIGLAVGENPMRTRTWNPLTNDGDAFRLAVKLDMNVFQAAKSAYALTYDDDDGTYEKQVRYTDTNNDPYAATRLAIVRAAAEIGKAMP